MKIVKHITIDSLFVVSLLATTLFPNFSQAIYFEEVACTLLFLIISLMFLGFLLYILAPEEAKKDFKNIQDKNKAWRAYSFFSDVIIVLAAIYSMHCSIAIGYAVGKTLLLSCYSEKGDQNE